MYSVSTMLSECRQNIFANPVLKIFCTFQLAVHDKSVYICFSDELGHLCSVESIGEGEKYHPICIAVGSYSISAVSVSQSSGDIVAAEERLTVS